MKITLKSIYIFVFLFLPALAAANTYYVTQHGNGIMDGKSPANAWAISDFNALRGTGYAGDTFYFSGTFTTRINVKISGTAGNPVTLDGYEGGDTAPLTDVWASSNGALLNAGMYSEPESYLIIQDFRMSQISGSLPSFHTYPDGINHFIFRRNYIHNARARCFQIGNGTGTDSQYVLVEENKMTDWAMGAEGESQCLTLQNVSNIVVRNNVIGHSDLGETTCSSCNTATIHGSNDLLFEYNEIYGAPQQAGLATKEGNVQYRHVYRFNKFYDNTQHGLYIGGGNTDLRYMYVYGNNFYNNGSTGAASYDDADYTYWWSNIFNNNAKYGYITWDRGQGSPNYAWLINNTFVRNANADDDDPDRLNRGGIVFTAGSDFIVKNNLFYNNRVVGALGLYHQIYDGGRSPVLEHNTYFHSSATATLHYAGGYRTLATMQGTYNREDDYTYTTEGKVVGKGKVVNPGFTDPDGADNIHGTADDDYTLDGNIINDDMINDGQDLSECFYVNLSGGDSWFKTQTGYSTVEVCFDDALDPDGTDWTTTPPIVSTVKRDKYGWSRGAYVYIEIEEKEKPTEIIIDKPKDTTRLAPPNPEITGYSN